MTGADAGFIKVNWTRSHRVMTESGWHIVVIAVDLDPYDDCPECGREIYLCPCPIPGIAGFDYRTVDGVLFARWRTTG